MNEVNAECEHKFGRYLDSCVRCGSAELGEVPVGNLTGIFCLRCNDLTATDLAQHCQLCEQIEWIAGEPEIEGVDY